MNKLQTKKLTRACARPRAPLRVLVACEESQAECTAFRNLGHLAFSCDIQPCKPGGNKAWHIKADVTPYLKGKTTFVTMDGKKHHLRKWDLIIAHPPCTYLCKVGSVWMYKDGKINKEREKKMKAARRFFMTCLMAKAEFVAVENPIPQARAQLPRPTCYIQPSWFGVKYTKKTLYWLKNLPPIWPTIEHPQPKCYVTASRGKYRSRTFPQVAEQIAKQWSDFILSKNDLPLATAK